MATHLVIDTTNILFRIAAVQKNKVFNPEDLAGMCLHSAIISVQKLYKKYKPDHIVFAFEGGNIWRKDFTETSVSGVKYKANRVMDPSMEHLFQLLKDFYTVMDESTSNVCLKIPGMERR